jgi:DNA gyrase/topoisomerase IV subunit B
MKTLAVLNRGRTIVYGFPDDEGTSEVKLKFENGLYDLLEIEKLRSIWDGYYLSTHIEFQSKECEAEIAFSVWENPTNLPFQVSFVNHAISPENGVHLEAVIESVRSTLNKYLREHFDKSELDRISERAIRRALNCAIHVKMARPHFEGSYKGKLLSPEIIKPIKDAVSTKLLADLNNDGSQAIEMVKYLSRNATLNQR